MMEVPGPVSARLQDACIDPRYPAFLRTDSGGEILEWGGDLQRYGIPDPAAGMPAGELLDVLEGLVPGRGASSALPFVGMASGTCADIHVFPADSQPGDWVVFLDTSAARDERARLQQHSNELALLIGRQQTTLDSRMEGELEPESLLERLGIMAIVLSPDEKVSYITAAAAQRLPHASTGQHWHDALDLSSETRSRLGKQPGRTVPLRIPLPPKRDDSYRLEAEVLDDATRPGFRTIRLREVAGRLPKTSQFQGMIGVGSPMTDLFSLIQDIAPLSATTLITGETGTGKELVARALHRLSPRAEKPLIVMNCAGLSDSLINSQLFGHRKGSFTDAVSDQKGFFEAADGGTIFLDEIGDIPINTQTRLLRVLEEREIVRIGENVPRPVDVRVVAATHRDLDDEVREGNFRLDLLYRIRVARIVLPPLRERKHDIPLLTRFFLEQVRSATSHSVASVSEEAMSVLINYSWPGNVRELRNTIEFATIRCREEVLGVSHFPPEIKVITPSPASDTGHEIQDERARILDALRRADGHRVEAAQLLGVSRATLYRRMRACGIGSGRS